jgi:hypothetical protein
MRPLLQLSSAARRLFVCVLILGAVSTLPQAQAATWLRAETSHFVIYSDIGESGTREYLEQLEAFKYLAELMLGTDTKSAISEAKFTIYLFDDQDLLKTVRPNFDRYIAGVYMHCVEGAEAFSYRPVQWALGQPDYGLMILLHEYAHHVMYSHMRRFYPAWYVEGFADYLSTVTLRRGVFTVGGNNKMRSDQLSSESGWMDFKLLLDPKVYLEAAQKGRLDVLQFYAQSWVLTHFMLSDSARAQAFNQYFDAISKGQDAIASFESATGIPLAKLAPVVRNHWRKLPGLRVTVPNLPDQAISISTLAKDQDDYIVEAATLQTCPDKEYGTQLTERLRAMSKDHANDPAFQIALARAEVLFGDPHEARAAVENLITSGHESFDALYVLGRSYYEEALKGGDEKEALMKQAMQQFAGAYRLNKLHPPTLYYLSRTLPDDSSTPSKSVLNAATGAALLAPGVSDYAINAAVMNLRADDRQTAVRIMKPFASDPHNPVYAARVAAMIEAIEANKELAEVIAALNGKSE